MRNYDELFWLDVVKNIIFCILITVTENVYVEFA